MKYKCNYCQKIYNRQTEGECPYCGSFKYELAGKEQSFYNKNPMLKMLILFMIYIIIVGTIFAYVWYKNNKEVKERQEKARIAAEEQYGDVLKEEYERIVLPKLTEGQQ